MIHSEVHGINMVRPVMNKDTLDFQYYHLILKIMDEVSTW